MDFHTFKTAWQRNCTVVKTDEKGKEQVCNGNLKEWLTAPADVRKLVGSNESVYRCRRCGALYKGSPERHLTAGRGSMALPPQFPVVFREEREK